MPLPDTIVIPIKTLTPIWTGDADGKTSYIKGSSLIGGLRFWTEALLRSFGEKVCDITSDGKDIFDKEKHPDICNACEIFGCTGKGRSFSLKMRGGRTGKPFGNIKLTKYQYQKMDRRKGEITKTPTWYFKDPGKIGDFQMDIMPLRDNGIRPELALSLALMLKWGTLGAKDQFGFGFVKPALPERLVELAQQAIPVQEKKGHDGLSFQDFFYFTAGAKHQDIKLPFEIRYLVRRSLADSVAPRHYFCGTISAGDNACTKYNIGMANGGIKGWGFFPKDGPFSNNRDRCLNNLKNTLSKICVDNSVVWREFQSKRDPGRQDWNWSQFLRELLEGGIL